MSYVTRHRSTRIGARELGEVFHTAAALVLDPAFTCELVPQDGEMITARAKALLETSGPSRVAVVTDAPGRTFEATECVAMAFGPGASERLDAVWFGRLSDRKRRDIDSWADDRLRNTLRSGSQIVAVWSRVRDDHGPERNMTSPVAHQLIELVSGLGSAPCLFGDRIEGVSSALDLRTLPLHSPFDCEDSLLAQLYLMKLLRTSYNLTRAIGAKSGAMDGHALLGLSTLSLVGSLPDELRMTKWVGPIPGYELSEARCLMKHASATEMTDDELSSVERFLGTSNVAR